KRRLHDGAGNAGGGGLDAEIDLLPVAFLHLRFAVEGINLANAAVHEQLDDAANLRLVVQSAVEIGARPRYVGQDAILPEHPGQRHAAESAALPEEIASRQHKLSISSPQIGDDRTSANRARTRSRSCASRTATT